jgi:hypothetical protein
MTVFTSGSVMTVFTSGSVVKVAAIRRASSRVKNHTLCIGILIDAAPGKSHNLFDIAVSNGPVLLPLCQGVGGRNPILFYLTIKENLMMKTALTIAVMAISVSTAKAACTCQCVNGQMQQVCDSANLPADDLPNHVTISSAD